MAYYSRTKNIFNPESSAPFKLSRSKIENYLRCPLCFYLDRRLGVSEPSIPAFTLNSAVDHLLKKEFDIHRTKGEPHPLMKTYNIDAVPFTHPNLDQWRENFVGVQYHHEPTNLLITGAVDDVWVNKKGELIVVDYKATAKDGELTFGDSIWHDGYKRQMEIYQWLLRQNKFSVSDTGYFVYVNGKKDRAAFDGKLEFDVKIFPYVGDSGWVEKALLEIKTCLTSNEPPKQTDGCEYCKYREQSQNALAPKITVKKTKPSSSSKKIQENLFSS